jgi:hypothetical protein
MWMVMDMRRVLSALAVVGMIAASVFYAQSASGYPVGTQAEIFSSTTTPFVGETIEVSGKHYHPLEDVTLTIDGIFVGTAHTDVNGAFDPPAIVPDRLGDRELLGVGASGQPDDVDSLILHIRDRGVGGTSASSSPGGGLSFTGVQVAGLGFIAAVLLVGGGLFVAAGRKRKSANHA